MNIHKLMFLVSKKNRIKRHALLWLCSYVFLIIFYPPHGAGTLHGLDKDGLTRFYEMSSIRAFFHLLCQMLFCYPLLYFLMPFYFWEKKYLAFTGLFLLLFIGIAAFRYLAFGHGYNPLMEHLGLYVTPAPLVFDNSIMQTINGPAFIGFAFIAGKTFKDWRQKQRDNYSLERENYNAELQLLKAQIHPHFLFNTLNNIYFFVLSEPGKAKELVNKLEKLLHYMITECEQPVVPLTREIDLIIDYFELEKVRYNALDIELKITGDCTNKMIAPLLMIPFIENSFKHGTSKILRDPWIKLFIQADEGVLHFTLTNNKPAEAQSFKKAGIGLSNVKKRLRLLHPEKHYLLIEPTLNTFTVNMQIPLVHKPNNRNGR